MSTMRLSQTSVIRNRADRILDLDDPETNFRAMPKLSADPGGKDCLNRRSASRNSRRR